MFHLVALFKSSLRRFILTSIASAAGSHPMANPQVPQPSTATMAAIAPQVPLANNIHATLVYSHERASVPSEVSRQEFTQRLISEIYAELFNDSHQSHRVVQLLIQSLQTRDIPLLVLHTRMSESSLLVGTILESLLTQFEWGEKDYWRSSILANLKQHPYEADITGVMQIIIEAIARQAQQHGKVTQLAQFLLDLAEILLAQQQDQQHHHAGAASQSTIDVTATSTHRSTSSSSHSYSQFNLHVALHKVISLLPSAPLHPLWLSFIRLLSQHGASSSVPNGLGETPIHTLIERTNIYGLLAWLVDASHNLHSFNLNSRHSPENLSYIRSVYESAAIVEEENPYSTPAKLCLEVVTKIIEWQDKNRQQYEMKEDEEPKATNGDAESKMDDIELTSATSSFTSPVTSFNIKSWLHQELVSLPRVLLSSQISNEFRVEKLQRDREANFKRVEGRRTSMVSPVSAQASVVAQPVQHLYLPPPTSAMKYFIAALVSHPNDIQLDECGLIDHCLLAHILMTPHALTHILSVPHAADLFLWRIDAMSREGMIRYKTNCTSAIYALFSSIVLDESNSQGEQSFIYSLYDAMLAKYVEAVKIDGSTRMIIEEKLSYQRPASGGWICCMDLGRWRINAIMRILTLLRKHRIPHNFVKNLLSSTAEEDIDRIREYIQLTITSDFLEPAFCIGGKNIYDQAQESTNQIMKWIPAQNKQRSQQIASERLEMIQHAYAHVITVVYPQLRREIEVWMIPDLASLTMEYLVHKAPQQPNLEDEMTRTMNERSAIKNW